MIDLRFSVRASNALINAGIENATQLINLKYDTFCKIENLGAKTATEVINKLREICVIEYVAESELDKTIKIDVNRFSEKLKTYFSDKEFESLEFEVRKIVYNICSGDNHANYYLEMDKLIISQLYENEKFKNLMKNQIYSKLSVEGKYVSLFSIKQNFDDFFKKNEFLDKLIFEMENQKLIEISDNQVRRWFQGIEDYVNTIEREKSRMAINCKLNGLTLEETGATLGVTRERARQLIKKYFDKKPRLREDDYRYFFEKYDTDKNDFIKIFEISERQYNYLVISYDKGITLFEETLEDITLSDAIRRKCERIIYKNYLTIGSVRIEKNRTEITKYILKTYCENDVTISDFREYYDIFLMEYELYGNNDYTYTERYLEVSVSKLNYVLWKFGKKFRYYDILDYDMDIFVCELNLQQYVDLEVSSKKIFDNHLMLMEEYNINDEYELHNLLKKLPTENIGLSVVYNKMPSISFGNSNRDMQVLDMLLKFAPIVNTELALEYEKEYGFKVPTILANFFKCIEEYLYNSEYSINFEHMEQDELEILKNNLLSDFYFIEDVKLMYKKFFPNGNVNLINSYNLKRINFKVNTTYIFSDKYTSGDYYFRSLFISNDIIDLNVLDKRLVNLIQSSPNVLSSLLNNLEVIEFSYYRFININKLIAAGVSKDDLLQYIDEAIKFSDKEYFTIKYLTIKGFVSELDSLGFEEMFYSSIIRTNPNVKFRKISNNMLLKESESQITITNFIVFLLGKLRKIDIYELIKYIEENYGLKIEKFKLIQISRNTELHYDAIMEKIYIDYDEYYEEI